MTQPHEVPEALRQAIARETEGRGGLRTGSRALTETYRAGAPSGAAADLSAYLASRMPATYAAASRVLAELAFRLPGFAPQSLLDAGAGPGTASWAACHHFPELAAVTLVDTHPGFLALAQRLGAAAPSPALRAASFASADLAAPPVCADLVVAAYCLAECAVESAAPIACALWPASSQALAIIEPGTPQGFARIRAARAALIAAGAHIIAPCTHATPCPVAGPDWCHFSVRLPRSRLHMQAKGARVPFEDERFSYVIAARRPAVGLTARIIAPPDDGKAGLRFRLCSGEGITARHVARREADAYKRLRKRDWGDLL